MPSENQTYASAGVSLATAEAVVDRLRAAVASTRTPGVVGGLGAFAGLFAIDDRRLLAASTDSVGSKLVLARRAGKLRWCGADLAAHGINDVLTTGAEPLFFLDYVAASTIDPEQVAELVEGAAEVCRALGLRDPRRRDRRAPRDLPGRGGRLLRHRRGDRRAGGADRRVSRRAGRRRRRAPVGGNPRQRLLARPPDRRRRPVRRRAAAPPDTLLPRARSGRSGRAPTSARSRT